MENLLKKYGYSPDREQIGKRLEMIASSIGDLSSSDVLTRCLSLMDLTTLQTQDTPSSVRKFVSKVNAFPRLYPDYPLPASICVYPCFAPVVRAALEAPSVHVTAVAGGFPSSQSFLEVKVRECALAVSSGADEIDIVLNLGAFLDGDLEGARAEIRAMRAAVDAAASACDRRVVFKVILETGLLVTPDAIAAASFLAMEEGADFIKTSTGKVSVNATPMAAYVMCECIALFAQQTGRKVGFKAAGGISTARDAVSYYSIVKTVLGEEWLCPDLFRFGVSRLANALMSAIEQKTVTYF